MLTGGAQPIDGDCFKSGCIRKASFTGGCEISGGWVALSGVYMSKRGANSALRKDGFGPLRCLAAIACLLATTDTRAAELEANVQPWPSFAEARLEIADMAAEGSVAAAVAAEGQPEPQPAAGFSFATAQIQIAIQDGKAGSEAGILVAEAVRESAVPAIAEVAEGSAAASAPSPTTQLTTMADAAPPPTTEPMKVEPSTAAGSVGIALSPVPPEQASPTAIEVGTTLAAGETVKSKVDNVVDTTPVPAPQARPDATEAAAAPQSAATDAKTAEPATSETVTSAPASGETSHDTTADIPGTTAVPVKSERAINTPPPVPDYYAERAKSLLEDERAAGAGPKIEGFPDHSIVVCVGGCTKNDVSVVYAEPKPRVIKTGGEMIPTAAQTDDALTEAATPAPSAAIECVAGCYDSAPRRYRSSAAAEMQRKIQAAAAAAVAPHRRQVAGRDPCAG